jgi:transposase
MNTSWRQTVRPAVGSVLGFAVSHAAGVFINLATGSSSRPWMWCLIVLLTLTGFIVPVVAGAQTPGRPEASVPGPMSAARTAWTRRLGIDRLESVVRREIIRRGKQRPCLRIVRLLFAALTDRASVTAHRPGALERVALLLGDWLETHRRLVDTERRMTAVLDELGLTGLVTSITGLSAIGAAAILAETGDLNRFATARALVKHAGLAPREKLSGTFVGRTKLTGQGRPSLRLAAWRAVWGAQRANPVYAARFTHLTKREQNSLTVTQAQAVIAAAILRHLHAIITTGQRWDSVIATLGGKRAAVLPVAA